MSLVLLNWGGNIHASNTVNSPVEIWSNSLALIGPADPDVADLLTPVLGPLESWFTDPHTYIDATVSLDYLRINEFNVLTGHQITDPSFEYFIPGPTRGYVVGDYSPPLTTSYKVSIDDSTRNRHTKGGWFVPRAAMDIEHDGRMISGSSVLAAGTAQDFLISLNEIVGYQVGVWSRSDHSVTAATRVRVGNVPDNIRRRKNALPEAYATNSLV